MDLSSFVNKSHCECLNESDEHGLAGALTSEDGFLESDCDEQVRTHMTMHAHLYCGFFARFSKGILCCIDAVNPG